MQTSNGQPISPPSDRWERLPGAGDHFVRPAWRRIFFESGLRTADDFFTARGEALSKAGLGSRYRARLVLPGGRGTVYLKRFGPEPWLRRWRRWAEDGCFLTPAEREVRRAEALLADGFPVAEALAWGRRPGPMGESFVVLAAVPGVPLHHWLQQSRERGDPARWQTERQLAGQLAELVGRFHSLGWRHRDLYLAHLFVGERADSGPGLWLIDLQRVFNPRWRAARWRIKDLAQLEFSANLKGISRNQRMRFAKDYANRCGLEGKGWIRAVLRKSAGIARRQ